MNKDPQLGDCVEANVRAFCRYLKDGKYPTEAKIPPNVCPDEMIGGREHQLPAFQKNIKRAYGWKLIQGTIINRMDFLPMAHCWCEATLDDMSGLYKLHRTLDGRFVFDFSERMSELFFLSAWKFGQNESVPLDKFPEKWKGVEHLYHRYEYNFDEAKEVMMKNFGTWKFYEFDTDPINAHREKKY